MSRLVNHISFPPVYSRFPRWILTGVSALGILTWLLILWFCLQFVWKMLFSSTFLCTVLLYVTSHCSLHHFSWLNALINSSEYTCGIRQCAVTVTRCFAVRFLKGSVLLLSSQVYASVKSSLRCKFWKFQKLFREKLVISWNSCFPCLSQIVFLYEYFSVWQA